MVAPVLFRHVSNILCFLNFLAQDVQPHLKGSVRQAWNQPFLQGYLVLFSEEKTPRSRCIIDTVLSLLLGRLYRNRYTCAYAYLRMCA